MTRSTMAVLMAATLLATPASAQVTSLADLRFGTVVAGVPESVTPTSSDAANYRIRYTVLGLATNFELTLPATLARVGGGATMPVSFCTTCGVYRINNSNPVGGTTFNPANNVSLPTLVTNSNVYIWLGGTITPASNQSAGSYTAGVVLTLYGVTL